MPRTFQFSLSDLFKDVGGIAIALCVLRYSSFDGRDAQMLPTIGLIVGILVGLTIRCVGEGAIIGCIGGIMLMYVVSSILAPLGTWGAIAACIGTLSEWMMWSPDMRLNSQ